MYALINCKIFTNSKVLKNHALLVNNELINNIIPVNDLPNNMLKYDLEGNFLAPGFIDLQINGCGGVQFNNNIESLSIETLQKMQITNQTFGCTSFLPTLITSNDLFIKQAVEITRLFIKNNKNQVLGLHLEGPYLNPKKKGIHNSKLIRKPTKNMINYLCSNSDVISKITIAPEYIEKKIISNLREAGICVSIGHSNATYHQTKASFRAGVNFATHIFNAMSPLIGRKPGVLGAVFDTANIYCSIIADGLHVAWANVRNAKRIKGDHLILITDATVPVGMKNISKFSFSEKIIYCKNGLCKDKNGIIGGSLLTLIQAVRNSIKYAKISLEEALRMVTFYPAKALGIENKLGDIAIGKIANLTVLNKNLKIVKTIVNGKI